MCRLKEFRRRPFTRAAQVGKSLLSRIRIRYQSEISRRARVDSDSAGKNSILLGPYVSPVGKQVLQRLLRPLRALMNAAQVVVRVVKRRIECLRLAKSEHSLLLSIQIFQKDSKKERQKRAGMFGGSINLLGLGEST